MVGFIFLVLFIYLFFIFIFFKIIFSFFYPFFCFVFVVIFNLAFLFSSFFLFCDLVVGFWLLAVVNLWFQVVLCLFCLNLTLILLFFPLLFILLSSE